MPIGRLQTEADLQRFVSQQLTEQFGVLNFHRIAGSLSLGKVLATEVLTELPTTPSAGQLVVVNPETTIHWLLLYDAADDRWVFLGGQPIFDQVGAAETTTSDVYVDLTTIGPEISVPFDGDYRISHGFSGLANDSTTMVMSYDFGSGAVDADGVAVASETAIGNLDSASRTQQEGGLLSSQTLTSKYRSSTGNTGNFRRRWLTISPIFLEGV